MNRIVIIGATGTSKSTLASRLGHRLGFPVIDLDDLHWRPGWIESSAEDFRRDVTAATASDRWIVAGNYHRARDIIWPRADTLVWLDYGLAFTLARLLRRTARRVGTRQPACNGNIETLGRAFSKDSIILWLFRSYHHRCREFGAVFRDKNRPGIKNYIRLRTPQETETFLSSLSPPV